QAADDLRERILGALVDNRAGLAPDRMLDDGQRQIWHPEVLRFLTREPDERLRADGHRGNALPLQLDRVVDTPRRARPSVADRGDDRADLLRVGVEAVGADRRARLLLRDGAGHAVVLPEQLDEVPLELERVRLAVVEDAQGDAVE